MAFTSFASVGFPEKKSTAPALSHTMVAISKLGPNIVRPFLHEVVFLAANYSHLSNKRTGWNKRVLRAEFFCYYMKKRLLLHRNKRAGGTKAQKSISEALLLDRRE